MSLQVRETEISCTLVLFADAWHGRDWARLQLEQGMNPSLWDGRQGAKYLNPHLLMPGSAGAGSQSEQHKHVEMGCGFLKWCLIVRPNENVSPTFLLKNKCNQYLIDLIWFINTVTFFSYLPILPPSLCFS